VAGVLVDRTDGAAAGVLGLPLVACLSLAVQSWEPGDIPDWLAARPVERPGSTGKR
jgi:hypothetical protein